MTGSGEISSYSDEYPAPWMPYGSIVEEIVFNDNITGIGSYAFDELTNLNEFDLPNKLTKIGSYAFRNCKTITYVEIPAGVKELGRDAFTGCTSLEEIVFTGDAPNIPYNVREKEEEEIKVYIPEVATGWNERTKNRFGAANWIIWDNTAPSKEIVMVLDTSGSMEDRMEALKTAAISFVEGVGGIQQNTEISVVQYNSSASTIVASTTNKQKLIRKINSMTTNTGTQYAIALNQADRVLSVSDADRKLIVMFSDGEPVDAIDNIYSVANSLRIKYGNTIYTVGLFSNDSQRQILINVAGSESHYFEASDISELISAFLKLSEDIDKKEVTTVEIKRNGVWYDAVKTRQSYSIGSSESAEIRVTPALKYEDVGSIALYRNGQMYLESAEGTFTVIPGTEFKPGDIIRVTLFTATGEELESFVLDVSVYTDFTVTYYYNYDHYPSIYKQETVRAGIEYEPPKDPVRSGYKFTGWYTNETCTGLPFFSICNTLNRRKNTGDIELYAGWKTAISILDYQTDTWKFRNVGEVFCNSDWAKLSKKEQKQYEYEISSGDFGKLLTSIGYPHLVSRQLVWNSKKSTWGGSCFGMSSVVALAKEGELDIVNFNPKYKTIHAANIELNSNGDKDVSNVESMINFYHLRQDIDSLRAIREDSSDFNESKNLKKIVETMEAEDGRCVVLWLRIKSKKTNNKPIHAVVGYDFKQVNDHEYTFKVYDCSLFTMSGFDVTVTESNGSYTASYDYWEEMWKRSDGPDTYLQFFNVITIDGLKQEALLVAPSILYASGSEDIIGDTQVNVFTNYPAFTVTNGSQTAVIEESEVVSDSIGMTAYGNINEYGAENKYYFTLPVIEAGESYTITPAYAGLDEYSTTLSYENMKDGFFANVISEQGGTMNVDRHGKVTTSYETASAQEINVCSEEMTTSWYSVTVKGSSTGLTVDPGTDTATISSSDNALVNVSVENDMNVQEMMDIDLSVGTVQITEENNSVEIRSGEELIDSNIFGYSVVFNSQYGTPVETLMNVPSGSRIAEPADPQRDGYFFEGWYKEDTYENLWDFENDTITADTQLYAGWSIDENFFITVIFKRKKQNDEFVFIPKGTVLDPEEYPVLSEETDGKWYVDSTLTIEWNTAKEFTRNIVLYSTDWQQLKEDYGDVISEDIPADGIIPDGIWTAGIRNQVYTGSAIKQSFRVYDEKNMLQEKADYTITYKNNSKAYTIADPDNLTAVDKKKAPQIIIKSNSKGNYKGSKTIYFSIEPLDINDEQITVDELSVQAGTKPVSPVPVVYFNGKKLKAKTDYTVDYNGWNQMDPGDITIKIHGKGNFQGARDVTVHVASSDLISVAKLNVTSKALKYADLNGDDFLNEIASAVTVKNGKKAVSADSYHFEDIPEDYKKAGTVKFTLVGNEAAGFYGKKTVTVKITGIALTDKKIKATVPSYVYTGEPQALGSDFSIKYSEELLEEGKDYTIESYSNNINAGTATVVLNGLGNYTGTKKVNFRITPADASGRDIHVDDAYYTKGGSKPKVTIEGLVEGTDFTVKYANNKAVTTPNTSKLPTVTITFKGNYKGTVTRDFFIDPKPLSAVTITAKDKVYSTKANAWKSAPVLKDTDGKTLKAGTDYEKTIIYTTVDGEELPAVVEAGTVIKVTVTGKGNYTGTASTTYRILDTGKDISKMTFKIANQEYTGSPVMIEEGDITSIKLGKNEQDLVLGRDYEIVSYTNNINKGTAKVTFQGKGEYGGTKIVSFKIGQRSIKDYWSGVVSFFSRLMN